MINLILDVDLFEVWEQMMNIYNIYKNQLIPGPVLTVMKSVEDW